MTPSDQHKSKLWPAIPATVLAIAVLAIIWVWRTFSSSQVQVNPPEPPVRPIPATELAASESHLSLDATLPTSSIAALLETVVPRSYHFDSNHDVHIFGTPSRGPITVTNDVPSRRVKMSTPVGGRIQVEKQVIVKASVGIDVSGGISASFSPEAATDWTIQPHLELGATLNRAVAKTPLGDIDITGHVRGAVGNAINGARGRIETGLANALKIRGDVEKTWNKINSVHQLATKPTTWLRITPRHVTFAGFQYTNDAIRSGLALTLETRVFIQEKAPDVLPAPLPALTVSGAISDAFTVSLPIEVSYTTINQQLNDRLTSQTIKLADGVEVTLTSVSLVPYGDGVLLTVGFDGAKGLIQRASGRLYIVGIPSFDPAKSELRVDNLKYTAESESYLLKTVEWLAHSRLLDSMKASSVVNLASETEKAKKRANEQLENLNKQLPKEISANVSVSDVKIERLAFAKECAFVVVTVQGKMAARLR